jgi:HSP20 family protein
MNDVQDIMNDVARQVNADHHPGSAFSPSHRAARPMKEGEQMATRTRWDPFQDLRDAQEEMAQMTQMSQMLARALGLQGQQQGSGTAMAWAPALDISERKDAYLVTVELPGVEAEDLEITL